MTQYRTTCTGQFNQVIRKEVPTTKGIKGKVQANRAKKIKRDPLAAVFYYNRGLAYYHSQDPAKAIADFTMALKLDLKKESDL